MNFEDLCWLFTCDNRNRGILRMNFDEAALLWKSVRMTDGPLLEIGRRHAGSTVLLTVAAQNRSITSIDIDPRHAPESEEFLSRQEYRGCVELLVQDSRKPLPGRTFGMMFIDGDHSYEGVLKDTLAHWASLRPCNGQPALVAYHDAVPNEGLAHVGEINHCPGVTRLCEELVAVGAAKRVASAGSLLVLEKQGELPEGFPN